MPPVIEALVNFFHRSTAWLRSYRGSVWVVSALCMLLAVWVVPFQLTGQSQATVDAIAWGWLPLQVVYFLTAIATLYCTYFRLIRDVRRLRGTSRPTQPSAQAVELATGTDIDSTAERLASHGYEVQLEEDRLVAVKNKWSALGGSVFHVALIVFAVAVVLQLMTPTTARIRVIEGQSFKDAMGGNRSWASGLVEGLTLKSIKPSYFKDVLLFTRLDATLNDAAGAARKTSLARPLWLDAFTHLSVQDYGLAPSFLVTDAKGKVLDDTTVALAVNPPGARDSATLPGSGLTISVVAFPDYGVVDGKDVSLSYNLKNPRLRLSATGEGTAAKGARGLLGVGDTMKVGDYTVKLTGVARHGTFSVFRSYSTLPIALASLLMLAGLVMRLLLPRHDVIVWRRDGGMWVDAWTDTLGRSAGIETALDLLGEAKR